MEAAVVPREIAALKQFSRRVYLLKYEVFVSRLVDAVARQNGVPMVHKARDLLDCENNVFKVASKLRRLSRWRNEDRECGLKRISNHVNDLGVGKCERNES
jgi:hypothetical protein